MARDEQPLAGQAALITGGGGGIGGASAAWLARDGAAVVIMGRTESTLVATKQEILEFAGADAKVDIFVGDALDEAALRDAMSAAAGMADRLADRGLGDRRRHDEAAAHVRRRRGRSTS